jgi:hypothetical protein
MALGDVFKIKKFKTKIRDLESENKQLKETILNLDCKLQQSINIKNRVKDVPIDINKFCTNEYKSQFEFYAEHKCNSDDELFKKFNDLLNEEKFYIIAFTESLDFIKNKRNKKLSTEKQLKKYILTNRGNEIIDYLIGHSYYNIDLMLYNLYTKDSF